MTSRDFPPTLLDGLWHTTTPGRYEQIRSAGCILPNPPIPDRARWSTSQGPDYCPYVRVLGGVSLFDFRDSDPESYEALFPMSNWRAFVPYRRGCGSAIWIDIDRARVGAAILDAETLRERQRQSGAHRHKLMPRIEVAHIGPLPLQAVSRVFMVSVETPFVQVEL